MTRKNLARFVKDVEYVNERCIKLNMNIPGWETVQVCMFLQKTQMGYQE
jgi:hypothetical protein